MRRPDDSSDVTQAEIVSPSSDLASTEADRPRMSSAEARARYLAALAAQAFSDEQMRLITSANIVDGEDLAALERSLSELPEDQLRALIQTMATNPSLLGEDSLANLASLLARHPPKADGPRQLR